MKKPMRTRIAAALVAGGTLFGGAFVGGLVAGGESAVAQEVPPDAPTPPSAEDLEARQAERQAKLEERLAQAVADGRITEAEADEIRTRIADRQAAGEDRRAGRHAKAEALADALGLTTDELKSELMNGASIADLAVANGIDVDTLIADMVAAASDRLDQAVADGRIDAARADEIRAGLTDKITARVNGERPERPEGFPGRDGAGRGFGPRFGGPTDAPAS